MEQNKEPNNPWEARRVNMTRPPNLMQDIKKPAPVVAPTPVYQEAPAQVAPPNLRDYTPQKTSKGKFYVLLVIGIIIVLLSTGAAFYFYQKSKNVENQITATPMDQLTNAVNEISQLVILPINDNPTLSVVVDAEEAKQNQLFALFRFFENAEVGDMWLSYQKTGKNILYRPTTNKIVNMMTFPPDAIDAVISTATSTATTTNSR